MSGLVIGEKICCYGLKLVGVVVCCVMVGSLVDELSIHILLCRIVQHNL